MHITKLSVTHFEGLESLEIEPGERLNLIEGGNGAGKTSVLEAIRVAFTNRGQRSLLVKEGREDGLILFELSDGTEGQREVNRKGYTAGSVHLYQDGGSVGSAQSFLDSIGLGFGFNPLEFVELRADQQTEKLLEVTPVDLDQDDLLVLSNGEPLDGVDYDQHPLKVLDEIKKALFEHRRDVGRDARDTEGMVEKLRAKVPEDFDRESVEDFNLPEAVRRMREARKARERVESIEADISKKEGAIQDLRERIAELEAGISNLEVERGRAVQMVDQANDPAEIEARIETYQQNQDHLQNLKQADEREAEAEALRQQYAELQEMLAEARETPGRVLSHTELPVEDLSIEDGEVTIKGLPISELSAGEQLKVAVDITLATLGDLKVVLVDGLETLDPGNQDYLLSRLTEAGVQAFVARIADGSLKVITDYAAGDIGPFGPDDDHGLTEPEGGVFTEAEESDDDDWQSLLDEVDGSEAPF